MKYDNQILIVIIKVQLEHGKIWKRKKNVLSHY